MRLQMTRIDIAPALDPEQWARRRCGSLAIEQVDDEVHVVVADPDGEVVSVSGSAELFALMALANDALPDRDPRKITLHAVFDVQVAAEMARLAGVGGVAVRLVKLADMLEAALPPRRIEEPELSQRR
jgi:hypothetical protein